MKKFKTLHNGRGFVLLVVYFVVIFVVIYSVALFARHRIAIQATERYQNRILAFNAAESGIDYALNKLSTQSDYAGTSTFTPLTPQIDTVRCGYTVTVETTAEYNQRHLANPTLYPDFVPIPVDPANLIRVIEARGFSPDNVPTSRGYQTSSVVVYCRLPANDTPSSLFTYGVYAENLISLSGNSAFDSYNSINGAYGGSNKSSAGEMAVNSTAPGSISLNGNSKINGSVYVGYGGASNTVSTTQNSTITGTRSNLSQTWSSPDSPETPEGATPITLNVSGNNTVTLAPGTYFVSSLKVSGNGKIRTTGAVKIYVEGEIDLSGNGVVVPNNRPENLLLYSTGDSAVKISGNGSFYGGIFAPNSAVAASGNGDVFGAVVSKTYTQSGNSATHFDLALKGIPGPPSDEPKIIHITAWQELNSLAWGTGS
jgi:hypothetical protein